MREKTFFYLVDRLSGDNSSALKAALRSVPGIESITVRPDEGMVEIIAPRKMDDEVRVACDAAGLLFRTRVKRRR
ncbi:MAG: hypothetical protein ACLFNZ_07945 [Spirochaetaceae bacterium]